ncbi:hypothetical protein BS47DRAFT_1482251 [Hydnum rufescens UP504]|uniref:Uncharacterized protein n=1 Tax=Hydnum rufescens UP504 TaxID=1448309 RepID=A0A9P6B999_9AGAM|nr:hypothetical protein BS47DRAFT_1482251 [Hydnum rufescens UP504]
MSSVERPLVLHISALSPEEYDLYTAILADLSGPAQDNHAWDRPVDVMEARGWIRGRYGLDAALVDKILRYFPTTPGKTDTLSTGQFFACMRLVLHAQAGRDPAKALVFVQANVSKTLDSRATSPVRKHNQGIASKFLPAKAISPIPPPLPPPQHVPPNRARVASESHTAVPPSEGHPSTIVPKPANPFRQSLSALRTSPPSSSLPDDGETVHSGPLPVPPVHPMLRSVYGTPTIPAVPVDSRTAAWVMESSQAEVPPSGTKPTNPFGSRVATAPTQNAKQLTSLSPPLPPRKPPLLPPRGSDALVVVNLNNNQPSLPPRPPPKPALKSSPPAYPPLATSSLMKESLKAAKGGQIQKANESLLGKTLNLEVIKRSSSRDLPREPAPPSQLALNFGMRPNNAVLGSSPNDRGQVKRNNFPSPPESTSSLEILASARLPQAESTSGNYIHQHRRGTRALLTNNDSHASSSSTSSDPPGSRDRAFPPSVSDGDMYANRERSRPPLPIGHDPRTSTSTDVLPRPDFDSPLSLGTAAHVGRSKSFHVHTGSLHTPPPPPRRRPESIQVLGSTTGLSPHGAVPHSATSMAVGTTPPPLSRRASLQSHHSAPTSGQHGSRTSPPPVPPIGEAFQHLYTSVKQKAESFQAPIESARRTIEGRVIPGGYTKRGAEGKGLVAEEENNVETDVDDGRASRLTSDGSEMGMDSGEWKREKKSEMGDGWQRL